MKNNMLRKVSFTILALAAAQSVLRADTGGFNVPDLGSSAFLLALSLFGVLTYRRFGGNSK